MQVFQTHVMLFFILLAMFLFWKMINSPGMEETEKENHGGFIRALYLAKSGKYVSRAGWLSTSPDKIYCVVYGRLEGEESADPEWFFCDSAGNCEIFEPTEADKTAEDWFVVT